MKLYSEGLSSKQIAQDLGISKKTVEYHHSNLFSKLKLQSMAHLVKMAVGFGLTTLCLMLHAGPVVLAWNNNNSTNLVVNIYYTTNLFTPTNLWPVLVSIPNSPPGTNTFATNLPPANYFFTAAFTNSFWGTESFFSNGAATPPLPTNLLTGFSVSNH